MLLVEQQRLLVVLSPVVGHAQSVHRQGGTDRVVKHAGAIEERFEMLHCLLRIVHFFALDAHLVGYVGFFLQVSVLDT